MDYGKVQVLLSTFNGEKYVEQLLESVLTQDYPNIELLIRDDGSNDHTINILQRYETFNNVKVIYGDNMGVTGSFLKLLELSATDAQYYAFCDQDDVWKRSKISRAVTMISKVHSISPLLYCSRYTVVDKNLNEIAISTRPRRGLSFANALCQNVIPGFTMVINRCARDLLIARLPEPKKVVMHDAWVYLVLAAMGEIIFDDTPQALYRQHVDNLVGVQTNFFKKYWQKVYRVLTDASTRPFTDQAVEFKNLFWKDLPQNKKDLLDSFLVERERFTGRLRHFLRGKTYRQGVLENLAYCLLLTMGRV